MTIDGLDVGISELISGVALIVSALGLARAFLGGTRQAEARLVVLETRVTSMGNRLDEMKNEVRDMGRDLLHASAIAAAVHLHREHDDHRLDALLEAYKAEALERAQLEEFQARLAAVLEAEHATERDRWSARQLLRELESRYQLMAPR